MHDATGFTELLDRHRGILIKVAAGYAGSPDERADLMQDIVAQLWRAWPAYDPARPFSTWMYRIALNVAIGDLRRRGREREHRDPHADEERLSAVPDAGESADPERARQVRALRAFIAAQRPLDRALLLMHLDGHGHRAIAEVLGIGESNVSTKLSRLRQRIRDEL